MKWTAFALAAWIRDNHPDVQVMLTSGHGPKIDAALDFRSTKSFLVKPYALHTVARHFMDLVDPATARIDFRAHPRSASRAQRLKKGGQDAALRL